MTSDHAPRPARLGLVMAIACACCVAFSSLATAQSTSPGPLARSHIKIDGAGKCGKCHEPGGGPSDRLCVKCHAEARKSTYHDKMARDSGKPCAKCHRDHHGRDFRMIRWKPTKKFDHRKTGYPLRGEHRKLDCAKCHTRPQRWMGLQQACASCHKDPHVPTLGRQCKDCHSEASFVPARRFQHDRARFKLRGRHRQVDCAQCHKGTGAKARYRGLDFSGCESCHADPVPGHSAGVACKQCHSEADWKKVPAQAGRDLHQHTKFPLRGAHRRVDCNRCHKARNAGAPTIGARLGQFRGLSTDCASCHEDKHRGQFGRDCASCHVEENWRVKNTRAFNHRKTGWPLKGRHARVPCAGCHSKGGTYKRRYSGVRGDRCTRCHTDPHGGPFPSVKNGNQCSTCHDEVGFLPAAYGVGEHARAGLVLEGAHRVVACRRCHQPASAATPPPNRSKKRGAKKRRAKKRRVSRAASRVAVLRGTPKECRDCHKDVHDGQFANRKPPQDCTSCHGTLSFAQVRFDHNKSRFPLQGVHAEVKCADCHLRPAPDKPVRFAGTPLTCAGCHKDIHRGQFAADGPKRDCDGCHTPVKGFKIDKFDHAKTRFALTGRHASVACTDCHRKQTLPGGTTAAHYRLGALTCGQCHANPHIKKGPLKKRRSARAAPAGTWTCDRCHQTTAWRALADRMEFDHDVTGVPLTGAHARAACGGCHRPRARDAKLPRECVGCHTDPHRQELGQRCDRCHTSRNWRTPRRFVDHRGSRFPLTGAHAMVDCRSCHSRQGRDTWRGTPTTCDACHKDRAQIVVSFNHSNIGVGCSRCHSTFAWAPSRINHDLWWPLIGRHKLIESQCTKCHTGGSFTAASPSCAFCHGDLVAKGKTHPDHKALGFPSDCGKCHTPHAWSSLRNTWHEGFFPIAGGDHARYANNCSSCHPTGMGGGKFDCIHCHDGEHDKGKMDGEHNDIGGYQWANAACLQCHPDGKE